MKITAVLIVENIEKSLPFWVESMGFEKTVEVPEGDRLGFVILVRDGAELMLQTTASVEKDQPQFEGLVTNTALFIEVEDFADILKRLEGYPISIPERLTFYGMREIGVRDPDNNIVTFAARA
jgi:catechol 2,3-dioxygenase-like lactoylglutathione lyase family enzyme